MRWDNVNSSTLCSASLSNSGLKRIAAQVRLLLIATDPKKALFYRTLNGAQVGDLFMSLIHTAELCGANSFDYLTELQRHAQELAANPAAWMPWNYRETLKAAGL